MPLQKLELYGVRHCYVEYNNSGVLGFHRVYLTKKCQVKVSSTKLEFAGDGVKWHKNYGYQAEGSVEASLDDTQLDGILWATPAASPVGGDDFSVRYFKGATTEMQSQYVGLRISIDGEDVDTGAPIVLRYRILKVQFDPDTPQDAQSETVVARMLSWSARLAKSDIVGASLTGMPGNGAFWVKDVITSPSAFDPVAGDVI